MSWSLKLFSVRGIAVRVHVSFVLVLLWAAYIGFRTGSQRPATGWALSVTFTLLLVVLLFVCVLLHELGHSLVAQLFGVKVQDITLLPIGGVARMSRLPERPYQEFVISAAGPATNILLAILLGMAALLTMGTQRVAGLFAAPLLLGSLMGRMDGTAFLLLLAGNNVLLALFNLVPAFPLDGGRLFRSILACVFPFRLATQAASLVGQLAAGLMAGIALITGNAALALVGVLVFFAAWQERQQVTVDERLRGLCVEQAMQPIGRRVHPLESLSDIAATAGIAPQAAYLVVEGGRLIGWLSRRELLESLRKMGPAARVGQHMHREAMRVTPGDSLAAVQARMVQERCAVAVVAERGRVVGLLSTGDLGRVLEVLDAYPAAFRGRSL